MLCVSVYLTKPKQGAPFFLVVAAVFSSETRKTLAGCQSAMRTPCADLAVPLALAHVGRNARMFTHKLLHILQATLLLYLGNDKAKPNK